MTSNHFPFLALQLSKMKVTRSIVLLTLGVACCYGSNYTCMDGAVGAEAPDPTCNTTAAGNTETCHMVSFKTIQHRLVCQHILDDRRNYGIWIIFIYTSAELNYHHIPRQLTSFALFCKRGICDSNIIKIIWVFATQKHTSVIKNYYNLIM